MKSLLFAYLPCLRSLKVQKTLRNFGARSKISEEEFKKFIASGVIESWLVVFFKVSNKTRYVIFSCSYYEKERIL